MKKLILSLLLILPSVCFADLVIFDQNNINDIQPNNSSLLVDVIDIFTQNPIVTILILTVLIVIILVWYYKKSKK